MLSDLSCLSKSQDSFRMSYKKVVARKLSVKFRDATQIVSCPLPESLKSTEVLVKNKFLGINASDINFTAGIYQPDVEVPFDCGFEALGEVVGVGVGVKDIKPGEPVITQSFGSFAEYQVVPRRHTFSAPSLRKEWLPLGLSGVTASIALQEVLKPVKGERAIVTAASGGTGQFACQLLKKVYHCTVVGMCSSSKKAHFLEKDIACDAAIQYSEGESSVESLKAVYPNGAHVAYESVGGSTLDDIVQSLALRGRILSIGSISSYQNASMEKVCQKPLPLRLLAKSASIHSFFLPHYAKFIPRHLTRLYNLVETGVINSYVDPTVFHGIESVYDAVEFMYSRRNCGKIVVEL